MNKKELKEELKKALAFCEVKGIKTVKEFKQLIIKR